MLKNENLYRLESLQRMETYELSVDDKFDLDKIEGIHTFRICKSLDVNKEQFLIDVKCKEKSDILLKINIL